MNLFSTLRAAHYLASDILPALRRLVTPPTEDGDPYAERQARLHADALAEREAAEEVLEPQSDCGLGEADECLCRACEWGDLHDGEDCGTLVRLWIDGYHSDPITAFVDWGDGRFTITAAHPFARTISNVPVLRIGPLTVYSTDELEWVVDRVIADRTAYGPEYTVICKPRVDVLRKSLISDDYLCWLWLDAEKRYAESASAVPGVAPVEAADNDPGAHPPTRAPGSPSSLTAEDLRKAANAAYYYASEFNFGTEKNCQYGDLAENLNRCALAMELGSPTLGQDPAFCS